MEKPEHIQLSEEAIYFLNSGIEAIIDDEVTQCFGPEQLSGWNLLGTRRSQSLVDHFAKLNGTLVIVNSCHIFIRQLTLCASRF